MKKLALEELTELLYNIDWGNCAIWYVPSMDDYAIFVNSFLQRCHNRNNRAIYIKMSSNLEEKLHEAIEKEDAKQYKEITEEIRQIAGNMNLSNVFFGGFKTPIEGNDNFEDYKSQVFEVVEGSYKNGLIDFNLDPKGIITEIKIKEGK